MQRRDLVRDLRALTRSARAGVFSLPDAAAALQLSRRDTTLRLRGLIRVGVVRRIARGHFFLVPIKSSDPASEHPGDTHAVALALFRPCYIGGWSAAAAAGLPFVRKRERFVATSTRVRAVFVRVGRLRFHLAHTPERLVTGHGIVSHRGDRSVVSDRERTLVDGLRSPSWLGGARHLARALREHCRSDWWDPDLFIDMLLAAGNGAAIKRLAALDHFLDLGIGDVLMAVEEKRTSGIVDLEPGAGSGGRIDTRSGVRLNVDLDAEVEEDDPEYLDYLDELERLGG